MRYLLPLVTLIFMGMSVIASYYMFRAIERIDPDGNLSVDADLATDSLIYTRGSSGVITVIIYSSGETGEAQIEVEIFNSTIERNVSLGPGINTYDFYFEVPAHIGPGNYTALLRVHVGSVLRKAEDVVRVI